LSRPPRDSKLSKREIGARMRALREERGLTQMALAEEMGLTQSNVSAMERGDRGVTIHQAVKLGRILRVSVDELLTGTSTARQENARPRQDRRFRRRLEQLESLPKGDKQALLKTIDAFLSKAP